MPEYLAIDGWAEFQKYRGKRAGFILDATDQNEKPKLSGLSHFTRSVLQEIRRLRGRTGKNVLYDLGYIARATHTISTDRPHLHHALGTLISRGILVITNQQDDFSKSPEIENKKEIKKEKELKPICAEPSSAPQVDVLLYLPLNRGEFGITEVEFRRWKELYPGVNVMQQLRNMVGWLESNPTRRKTRSGVKAFITRWLAKAQDRPEAAANFRQEHPNGNGISKADRKAADISATTDRVFRQAGNLPENHPARLQDAVGRSGDDDLAGNPERLLVSGVRTGNESPDSQPSKVRN